MTSHTRRSFLSFIALAVATDAASPALGLVQDFQPDLPIAPRIPTADTRLKFNPDGTRRPFRGNTVICHMQPQGATRDAVERLAADLRRSTVLPKIALLPTASYHMTVYPGANDQGRDVTGWPSDLPADASMDQCNRTLIERMRRFHLQCGLPLRMKVDVEKTIGNPRASTLRMVGADADEEEKIRTVRDRLVEVFGFRDAKHDEYGFHITLAYQLKSFTQAEQREYRALLERNVPLIAASAPVFEFGNPEFCTFPDMFRYDVQVLLAN